MNALQKHNHQVAQDVAALKRQVDERWLSRPKPVAGEYCLARLRGRMAEVIRAALAESSIGIQIEPIDRGEFEGDLVIKIPDLLKKGGPKNYIQSYVPKIVAALKGDSELGAACTAIETKGIYINVRLGDTYLLSTLDPVLAQEERFGLSDAEKDRSIVIDYSAPNAAKQLHAGHIRSTIIGHVLGNLHEACGARVYRVNHINDLGGFGFLLEGFRRWSSLFPESMSNNDRLLELYSIRRKLEKIAEWTGEFSALPEADRTMVERYFGPLASMAEFHSRYQDYCRASDAAFARLEAGDEEEVKLWDQMVQWSLADFGGFYRALGITIDFVMGESFYLESGQQVLDEGARAGHARQFTRDDAARIKRDLQVLLEKAEIPQQQFDSLVESAEGDVGAWVVPLPQHRRYVVLRADGRSIYATRDLGALRERRRIFGATDILYVVGQEQREHFSDLFAAAKILGLVDQAVTLLHIWFGFYVDAVHKRKLSSREGASNVHALLKESVRFFHKKYDNDPAISESERAHIAQQLAVGSLIFNDLRKDMRGAVEVDTTNLDATIEGFERSGGAYVVYAACRARGILRKYGRAVPKASAIKMVELNDEEVGLIMQVHRLPERIIDASRENEPPVVVRHLHELAMAFNAYYAKYPVIKDGTVNEHRLVVTAAVARALMNGLAICHIECPERI